MLYTGTGLLFDLQLRMRTAEVISAQQRLLCSQRALPVKPGSRSSNGTKKKKIRETWSVIRELFKEIRMSASVDIAVGV